MSRGARGVKNGTGVEKPETSRPLPGRLWSASVLAAVVLAAWPHVELDVTLDADDRVSGRAAWRVLNEGPAPLSELHFLLVANAGAAPNPHLSNLANAAGHWNAWSPASTDVGGVTDAAGRALDWRYAAAPPATQTWGLDRGVLVVQLPDPIPPGAETLIEITFETRIPHRRGDQGAFNGDVTWRFGWFPQPRARAPDGTWSDEAFLRAFTHRTRFASARKVVIGAQDADEESWWSEVPVRSVPFVASDRLRTLEREIEGVVVRVHYYPDLALLDTSRGEAEDIGRYLRTILPHFNRIYGPYRFRRLEVVESPTTYLSMAGDGLVLLGDLFFVHDRTWVAWGLYERLAETVLAHELAHQWWGLALGVAFDRDNWLSEGLAQLLALSYAEAEMGGDDLLRPNFFLRWMSAGLAGVALPTRTLEHQILPSYEDHRRFGIDEPLVLPDSELRHVEESGYRLYEKGYLGARALRSLLGVADTQRVLREVYARRAGRRVRLEDLRTVAQEVCGVDLGPLIDGFVLGEATADLQIVGVEGRHVQVRREGELALPALVVARGADGRRGEMRFAADVRAATLVFEFEPESVAIDPDAWVPDIDRSNNVWPGGAGFDWFAPQADVYRHRWAFNPMPIHRRYLLGVSFGGRTANESVWSAGAGTPGFGQLEGAGFAEGIVYAETGWAYDRGRAVFVSASGDAWMESGEPVHQGGDLFVANVWSLYEGTDVGQLGQLSLPRTIVSLGAGLDVGQRLAEDAVVEDVFGLEDGVGASLVLGVFRDDRLNHGADYGITLTGGLSRADLDPFGVGTLSGGYGFVIPYLGHVELAGSAAAITPGGPVFARPPVFLATQVAASPFEALGRAGATLRLPVLRDRRIKNVLTLGLLVLDDVSVDVGYQAVHGLTYDGGMGDALGEASAALAFGIGAFPGHLGDLLVGVAMPVWPSAVDPDAATVFVGLGIGAAVARLPVAGHPVLP